MDKLNIEPTHRSPEIKVDPINRIIKISGNSFPPDPSKIFSEIGKWIDIFYSNPSPSKITLDLNYFDRVSYGYLMKFIKKFEDLSKNGSDISLTWLYSTDDPDIKELGESIQEVLSMKFDLREKTNIKVEA